MIALVVCLVDLEFLFALDIFAGLMGCLFIARLWLMVGVCYCFCYFVFVLIDLASLFVYV